MPHDPSRSPEPTDPGPNGNSEEILRREYQRGYADGKATCLNSGYRPPTTATQGAACCPPQENPLVGILMGLGFGLFLGILMGLFMGLFVGGSGS